MAAAKAAGAGDVIGKRKKPAAGGDDFDFGGKGLDDGAKGNPNDINDFDFGSDLAGAKEEVKEPASDEFDFNFAGGDAAKAKPSEEPAAQTGDLLDLLGGLDMNAGTEPAQADNNGKNALDFFNDDTAKNEGALGAAA